MPRHTHFLFWHGGRLLTEVRADTEREARELAGSDTAVACAREADEPPYFYRTRLARARVQILHVEA